MPKPLGALLGLLAVPLPSERGFAVIVAHAGVLFATAYREGGALAGAMPVAVVVVATPLDATIAFAHVNAAGCGSARSFSLGVLRQEARLLASVAGFTKTTGSWNRRVGGALAAGASAPALWMADLVLTGAIRSAPPTGCRTGVTPGRSRLGRGRISSGAPELIDSAGAFVLTLASLTG